MPDSSFIYHTLTLLRGGLDPSRSLGIVPEYYILPFILPVFSKHNIVNFSALSTMEAESNQSQDPSTFNLFLSCQQQKSLCTESHCYLWSVVNQMLLSST